LDVTLAIDMMGGDFGPKVTVPAVIKSLKKHPSLHVFLVGCVDEIEKNYPAHLSKSILNRIELKKSQEIPCENIGSFSSVRSRSDSPIAHCVDLIKTQKADALVSAGHTAYLISQSIYSLKRIGGIHRPAMCAFIPTNNGVSLLLDVGANLETTAENLYEYSLMGKALAKVSQNKNKPSIALMNVGVENEKGTNKIKKAAELISSCSGLSYQGYLEGLSLFDGKTDIIVCDGMSGNVALKSVEGVVHYLMRSIQKEVHSNIFKKTLMSFFVSSFKRLQTKLDPQTYNGGVLLGVQGIVVKSHGHANEYGFSMAIERAFIASQGGLLNSLDDQLKNSIIK
jgi:phosphate acyltransferase